MYEIIVLDLVAIQREGSFDANAKSKAAKLEARMRDPYFLSWLHFTLDLLQEITH